MFSIVRLVRRMVYRSNVNGEGMYSRRNVLLSLLLILLLLLRFTFCLGRRAVRHDHWYYEVVGS